MTESTTFLINVAFIPLIKAKNLSISRTVKVGKIGSYYGQYPMILRISSNCFYTLKPLIVISPDVGKTSLVRALKVVDLPAPLAPSKAKHSP